MADTIDVTDAADFIPEVWANRALGKLMAELHLGNNVARDFEYVSSQVGDTIHIPKRGTLQANAKVANTAVTLQNPASSKVDVTLDQHFEVTFAVEDIVKAQANQDVMDGYIVDAITVLGEKIETALAAKYSSLTHTLGTASTNLTESLILQARKKLTDNRAPRSDRFLWLDPAQINALILLDRFTAVEKYGPNSAIADGELGKIHGFRVFESIFAPTTGSPVATHNLAMHKNALILASRPLPTPKAPGVKVATVENNGVGLRVLYSYNADQLSDQVTIDMLFGVNALRPELGVNLLS